VSELAKYWMNEASRGFSVKNVSDFKFSEAYNDQSFKVSVTCRL